MDRRIKAFTAKIQRKIGKVVPVGMQLEITNVCNFKCIMCPFHRPGSHVNRPKGFMGLEAFREVVGAFAEMGGQFLIPQGAGESFMHPEFMEMLRIAGKEFGLKIGLNTNGSRLSQEDISEIITLGIDEIGFSVDALHETTFHAITGSDTLPKIENTIRTFAEMRGDNPFPRLRTLIVEQDENTGEIDEYVTKWLEIVDEVVVQVKRIDSGRKLKSPRMEKRKPCRHLFDTIFVQWDGDVVVCCEDWQSRSILGNAFDTTLADIWFGKKITDYRENQRKKIYSPPDICKFCEAWAGGIKSRDLKNEVIIETTALTKTYRLKDSA